MFKHWKHFGFFLKHVDWWVHHCRGLPMSLRRYIFRKYLSMSTTSNLAFYHENAARKVYPYVIFLFRNTSCFDKELDCLWSHSGGGRLWTWASEKRAAANFFAARNAVREFPTLCPFLVFGSLFGQRKKSAKDGCNKRCGARSCFLMTSAFCLHAGFIWPLF